MSLALVLALICGTASGWGADSLDCRLEDQSQPQRIVKARLYRALRWGDGMPSLADSLPASSGVEVCFSGIDSTIAATYWITAVNGMGKESCLGTGLSFPRVVGVDYPVPWGPWVLLKSTAAIYDLAGRRVRDPRPHRLYFSKGSIIMVDAEGKRWERRK